MNRQLAAGIESNGVVGLPLLEVLPHIQLAGALPGGPTGAELPLRADCRVSMRQRAGTGTATARRTEGSKRYHLDITTSARGPEEAGLCEPGTRRGLADGGDPAERSELPGYPQGIGWVYEPGRGPVLTIDGVAELYEMKA